MEPIEHNYILTQVEFNPDIFLQLEKYIQWEQKFLTFYGKEVKVPRLTKYYGPNKYVYSGIVNDADFLDSSPVAIQSVKAKIERLIDVEFNSVLCNFYKNGNDSISWHSDNEPELDPNSPIVSVSFGATRIFEIKENSTSKVTKIPLIDGSVFIMPAGFQDKYQHRIPKEPKIQTPRINLTFRNIYDR